MSDRRRLNIDATREAHEAFDNGCCSKCGIEDCDVVLLLAEVERLRARPYWNGTDAMSPGWEAAVAQVEQLRAAVRAVRRLPQRPWSEAEADGIEALQARAYNSGLNDARHAIDAALEGEL